MFPPIDSSALGGSEPECTAEGVGQCQGRRRNLCTEPLIIIINTGDQVKVKSISRARRKGNAGGQENQAEVNVRDVYEMRDYEIAYSASIIIHYRCNK